jgi:two-component system, OmpR family, response regulator BaeR
LEDTTKKKMFDNGTITVLLVEDDDNLAEMTGSYLSHYGFQVMRAADGLQALSIFAASQKEHSSAIDFVVLDINLPCLDGVEVCRRLRATSDVPILMATARIDEIDRLLGLEIGADDYLCKPYSPRELVARMRAILRRVTANREIEHPEPDSPSGAPLVVDDLAKRIYWRQGASRKNLSLTNAEFQLLKHFVNSPKQVFSRTQLLDLIHLEFKDIADRTIDTHIKNLRKKFKESKIAGVKIESVYGVGYRFEFDEGTPSLEH